MARIRTIKPEYFRHELLQDLEIEHPELHPMLVFAGLWGQCDKNGVFEYKPRQLKLDILPFLEYDMVASLLLLRKVRLVSLMEHEGRVYGFIPSFSKHQRINGQESKSASKFPQPCEMEEYVDRGTHTEAAGKQQGSNKEEGEGKGTDNREGNGGGIKTTTSKAERMFIETFSEKEKEIRELFPHHNFEIERATCIAHYRSQPPPMDVYCVIVKWFRRANKDPEKTPVARGFVL